MQIPLQITFRDMEPSAAVEAKVREKAKKLELFTDDITRCRVVIDAPHKHHHKGRLFRVNICLTLPGREIVSACRSDGDHAHEDFYVVLRDAFDSVIRQLKSYVRKRRGKVKHHDMPAYGVVSNIFNHDSYGVIETSDGRNIYFHRNSVLNGNFDKLKIGAKVHFSEEMGNQGPQASTVHVEGKHHKI